MKASKEEDLKKEDSPSVFMELFKSDNYVSVMSAVMRLESLMRQNRKVIGKFIEEMKDFRAVTDVLSSFDLKVTDMNLIFKILHKVVEEINKNYPEWKWCVDAILKRLFERHTSQMSIVFYQTLKCDLQTPLLKLFSLCVLSSEDAAFTFVTNANWSDVTSTLVIKPEGSSRFNTLVLFSSILYSTRTATLNIFLQSGCLSAIFTDMENDYYLQTINMLKLLRERILHNSSIEKNIKERCVFNSTILTPLYTFQSWTKPFLKYGERIKNAEQAKSLLTDEIVEFLEVVCCSSEFGILMESEGKPHGNSSVIEILRGFRTHQLECSKTRGLVSKGLATSMDLYNGYSFSILRKLNLNTDKVHVWLHLYAEYLNLLDLKEVATLSEKECYQRLVPFPVTTANLRTFTAPAVDSDIKYSAFCFMFACIETTKKLYELMVLENRSQAQTVVERIKVFTQESFPGVNALVNLWKDFVQIEIVTTETINKLEILVKLLCRIVEWFPSPEMVEVINADEILSMAQKINTDDPSKLSLIINCLSLSNSLQSKFYKSKETTLNVSLKNLFDIYVSLHSETESQSKNLLALKDHITKSLCNYGLTDHEANIEIWLQNLLGRSPKCVDFLCNSLQTTINNLEKFYDESVLTASNYDSKISASAMSSSSISRLIFGCLEVLQTCDTKVKRYFTDTLHLYFMSLTNPRVLVEYLLSKESYPELQTLCQCWLGRKPTENIHNKTSDTFSEKLDELFFRKQFKNVDSMLQSSDLPQDLDQIRNVVTKLVSYYRVDISETATNKKANGAYLKILQWVVDNSGDFTNVISSLILNQELVCSEYKAFVKNDISDFVDLLLTKKVSDSKDMLTYFNQAHRQLKVILKEGNCSSDTDFVKPFEHYLNNDEICTRKFVNTVSPLLGDLIAFSETHLKFDSYVSLLMKIALFVKKYGFANKNKYFEVIFNFCKRNIKADDKLGELYTELTSYLGVTVSPKRLSYWSSSDIVWMVSHCHVTGSDLLLRVVESNPTNFNMVLSAMKDVPSLLPGGMALIHHFFVKGSIEEDLSVKILTQLREPVISWLGNYDSKNDSTFVFFCSKLLETEVNLIEVSDITPIVKKFHKKLVVEGEMPPQHISTVATVCEKLKGHKKESKLASGDALITSLEMLLSTLDKIYDSVKNEKMLTDVLAAIDALLPKFKNRTKVTKVDSTLLEKVMKKMVEYGIKESTDSKLIECARGIYEFQISVDEDFNSSQLFSSIITHENFNALMLVSRNTGNVKLKESVGSFLHSILLKCPSAAEQLDVRVILASYSATNSPSDQMLLKILHLYESLGSLQHIRPVLFGERAQEYFGLTETTPHTYVLPNNDQILGGLNDVILVKTCLHFDRRISARVPESVSESSLLIYDVRFVLPVLSLVSDQYLVTKKVPHENITAKVLAVAVACLSAEDSSLRSISIAILRTMKSVYNSCTVTAMKTYWHTLIDIVAYSLAQMGHKAVAFDKKLQEKKNKGKNLTNGKAEDVTAVALPGPITRFIVETILVTEHPDHPLYKILRNYMFLFSTINTIKVPEKQRLFNDSNVESVQHSRMLLLRLVSDGLKTEDDARLVIMNDMVPLLMSLLESPTANQQLQIEIFSALISLASTQYGCNRLLRHSELLQMLPMYLSKVQTDSFWDFKASLGRLSNSLLKLLEALWENGHTKVEVVRSEGKPARGVEVNGEVEEEEDYYEEDYYEEYSDDDEEEKSKLRKKRKQEAKNRKAAKRQKLESAVIPEILKVSPKVYAKTFDWTFHLDFSQTLYAVVRKIKEENPSTDLFDALVKSVVTSIANREKNEQVFVGAMLDDVSRELSEMVSE